MIKILYNPDHPELIFSAAVVYLNLKEQYPNEGYLLLPMRASDLNKPESEITNQLARDMEVIMGDDYSYYFELDSEEKLVLLGIFPENKEGEKKILDFFAKNESKIILWVDWHDWGNNLPMYLKSVSNNIYIEPAEICLEILEKYSFEIFPGALEAEKAMVDFDTQNPLASRYLKAGVSSRSLGINMNMFEGCAYFYFMASVDELVVGKENKGISLMADKAIEMLMEAKEIKENFIDTFPEFEPAKAIGRPVGCLLLGEVKEYFCVEEVMEYGLRKYPWLCVVGFYLEGIYLFHFASEKIPISEIIKSYSPDIKSREEFFKILNGEIVRVLTA